jgi:predicted acetyltransferase
VHYSLAWEERPFEESLGTASVIDLFGATPAVELALWDYLAGVSLLRTIEADCRPVDDLVSEAMHDRRGYIVKRRWDEQWVRLLDVESALRARTYGPGASVTISVVDPWFTDNNDTFRVSADGVERVNGAADLVASIDTVSAAYLGTLGWRSLLAAGRLTDGATDAATRADALFAAHPGTWCNTFF